MATVVAAPQAPILPEDEGDFTSIPTIDISNIDSPSLDARKEISKEIYAACTTTGFFYLENHGLPEELLKETFDAIKRFFALDLDVKMEAHIHKNPAIRGYEPLFETKFDPRTQGDMKEAFSMGDCVIEPEQDYRGKTGRDPPAHITKPQNIWPPRAPFMREAMYKYYKAIYPLAMKLVRIMALAFDQEETAFDKYFTFPITGLRALHYPPAPVESEIPTVGLGAHSDFSWLTMVLQGDVPALEVLNKDGIWIDAPPKPNTFICNFVATVHRVRNRSGQERYSLPFFLSPDPDATLDVLDCCVDEGEKPNYEPALVGDLYIHRILLAHVKHPTSIKYRDVPKSEWKYELLYG
ncbi:2og-Fe oxygenase family protein [Thermoascus aurantiacus ATCC 26904]